MKNKKQGEEKISFAEKPPDKEGSRHERKDIKDKQKDEQIIHELTHHKGVRIFIGVVVVIGVVYSSRFLMNHLAESIRAYKNLRRAMNDQ